MFIKGRFEKWIINFLSYVVFRGKFVNYGVLVEDIID